MSLVAGVLGLNLLLLAAGYSVLTASLAGRPMREWASYAGVALLTGAGLVGLVVFLAAVAGAATGLATLAVSAALVGAAGVALRAWVRARTWLAAPRSGARHQDGAAWESAVATAACLGVVVVGIAAVVGGFRSSPWLDDAWGIWLPKGIALAEHGLDARLFVPNGRYVFFEVTDYPLWWSVVTGLDVRLAGDVDVRAMNAQLAVFAVAFVAASARLLWGLVRPWLLWTGLLLLVASPEFLRHTQSGMADLPLAIFLSLFLLAAALWLGTGSGFHLALAFPFGATALATKTEALPELAVLLAVVIAFALGPTRARVPALLAVAAAALATHVPWLAWRAANGIEGRVGAGDALSPGWDRVGPSAEALARHLFDPTEWLLVVPLVLVLALVGAIQGRRAVWLAVPAGLAVGFAALLWAYAVDRDEIHYLLGTTSYRVVDPLILTAAVFLPLLAERLLAQSGSRGR